MEREEQLKIIKRGTVEIISEEELIGKLKKKPKGLIIKAGFDPTAPDIHLGHTVLLRKLRHFQVLGHKVIFLIGDATALVGDPSGQSQTRKTLTWDEVQRNAKTYKEQVSKILLTLESLNLFELKYNSEWFSRHHTLKPKSHPFVFEDFVSLAQCYTIARLLERDDFQKRLKENKPISFLELFYPLMQGYDSVMLNADVEIGGTDQKFNMLVGRDLQEAYDKEPQVVITMPLLVGTDGVQKMSKSFGNYIGITESPDEIYGKVMSIPDEIMFSYYELLTDVPLSEIEDLKKGIEDGTTHPKDVKSRLAFNLVETYHSKEAAIKVAGNFEKVFKERQLPEEIPVFSFQTEKIGLLEVLINTGIAERKNEARRLILQGAVDLNGEKIRDVNYQINLKGKELIILKAGKRKFVKLTKKDLTG